MELLPQIEEKEAEQCHVCGVSPALGYNFGALSCDACKMFFRRYVVQNKDYSCNPNLCTRKNERGIVRCKRCRFNMCLKANMDPTVLEPSKFQHLEKTRSEQLTKMLADLMLRDGDRQIKLMTFYSTDDQSVENILKNEAVVRKMPMKPGYVVTADEWAFLALYSTVTFYMKFKVVINLDTRDKNIVFKHVTLPLTYFAGLMRTKNGKEMEMMSPGGNRIYPDKLLDDYGRDNQLLRLLCAEPVFRLHEMNVTNEEFCLMNMLILCNPAIPGLSEAAQKTLATWSVYYFESLMYYCRSTHANTFAGRAEELRSLGNAVVANAAKLENVFFLFHMKNKQYKFNQLVNQTFHIDESAEKVP